MGNTIHLQKTCCRGDTPERQRSLEAAGDFCHAKSTDAALSSTTPAIDGAEHLNIGDKEQALGLEALLEHLAGTTLPSDDDLEIRSRQLSSASSCDVTQLPSWIACKAAEDDQNIIQSEAAQVWGVGVEEEPDSSSVENVGGKAEESSVDTNPREVNFVETLDEQEMKPMTSKVSLKADRPSKSKAKVLPRIVAPVTSDAPLERSRPRRVTGIRLSAEELAKRKKSAEEAKKRAAEEVRKNEEEMRHLAATGDAEGVDRLFRYDVNVNAEDEGGRTALHLAAREGHIEIVRMCLGEPAVNANIQTQASKDTALHFAARHNQNEIASELVFAGALLDIKNKYGKTAGDVAQGDLAIWLNSSDPKEVPPPWQTNT